MTHDVSYKVLQVYRTYFPDTQGGAEEVVRQISLNVQSLGAEVKVVVPSSSARSVEHIIVDGVEVVRVPELCEIASCNIYSSGFSQFSSLVDWADIVHYHFPWPFQDLLQLFLVRGKGKKTVVTYHSDIIRQRFLGAIYKPLQNAFLGQVDSIVATSRNYAESSPILSQYADKLSVIPLGLNEQILPGVSDSLVSAWKGRLGEHFFFFVGVLRYYKGLSVLLKAVKGTNIRVVIAGDGPEMTNLQKQKEDDSLGNVTLLGRISDDDKVALMTLCKAVVLPSFLRSEAFGVTLLEGMYFGKPLITSSIKTGVSYVNQQGVTGFTVEPNSSRALKVALEKIDGDDDLSRQMGFAARQRYDELFSGEIFGKAYDQLYRSLVGGKS